jgi:hypothetical protein
MAGNFETVEYTTTVVVTVDLDNEEVVRVQVDDVNAVLDDGQEGDAVNIAEDSEWPAWEIGV